MKQLIVNADDLGRSPGVNRGIVEAHRRGIVTSTSVMVNQPAAPAGIDQVLADTPDLGLGLHLTLTQGHPVLPPDRVPSLVDGNGCFYPIGEWADRLLLFDPDDVRREIEAQVERFVNLAGRPPDHLDAHHHAGYLHPAGLETMLAVARRYNIPMRSGGTHGPYDDPLHTLRGWIPTLADSAARQVAEELAAVLVESPAPFWPARLEMGFYGERATLGDLLVILTTLPDGITEIVCHPGYADDLLAGSAYREPRETDLACLTHAATLECVKAEGIQLIAFGDVPRV